MTSTPTNIVQNLIAFVEKSNTHNLMYDRRIQKLVADYGCSIEPFDIDSYVVTSLDPIKSRPMKLAIILRKLGLFSKAVNQIYMIVSHDKVIAAENADNLRRSIHDLKMMDRSSVDPLHETMKDYVEMANIKLSASSLADQIKELVDLGYTVTPKKEGYQISIKESKLNLSVGEILSARARMEAYARQMFPGNMFSHFVVKYGLKSPTFSIGISLKGTSDAIANALS